MPQRFVAGLKASLFYSKWYLRQWLPFDCVYSGEFHPILTRHLRRTARLSRKLARSIFHALIRYGPKLERRQLLLGRLVDIGAELFAMSASCVRGQALLQHGENAERLLPLIDYFCRSSCHRIRHLFRDLHRNADEQGYRLAGKVMDGAYDWLQDGIVRKH
jgi:hypothetical protein